MARRKRILYKPDAFQSQGRRIAAFLLERGTLIVAGLILALVVFVVAAIISDIHATWEENAWTALGRTGGDITKLRAALAEYGSSDARPFMLFAAARSEIEPPREDGKPKPETEEDRSARLSRAENSLGEIIDEYPDHFLHLYALCLHGQVMEERGEYRDAAAAFETALASAPKGMAPKIKYDIGRNYYLAGMPKAARSHLETAARAGRTVRVEVPVPGYGYRRVEQEADWIAGARYLLARIGPGEQAISLDIPEKETAKPPESEPGDKPADAPDKPKGADETALPKPQP